MSAETVRRTERKSLEPFRHRGWLSPMGRGMEEIFEDFFRRPFGRMMWPGTQRILEEAETEPSVDIFEEKDSIIVKSDLPGMSKEDIEVNLTDDTITLSGEKKGEEKIERKNYFCNERSYGSFTRTLALPAEVQSDKASASFKNGVLEVRVPKSEYAKKKEQKIKIE